MRHTLLVLALMTSFSAHAGRWIPYTDGRAGGCFQNDNGHLYGCTPQANRSTRSSEDDLFGRQDDSRVRDLEKRTRDLESQNRALQANRDRQNAIDQAQSAQEQRRVKALNDSYTSRLLREQAEEGRRRERQWLDARTKCSGQEYADQLKKLGLKRHPSLQGICVPISHKPGSSTISAESCPAC